MSDRTIRRDFSLPFIRRANEISWSQLLPQIVIDLHRLTVFVKRVVIAGLDHCRPFPRSIGVTFDYLLVASHARYDSALRMSPIGISFIYYDATVCPGERGKEREREREIERKKYEMQRYTDASWKDISRIRGYVECLNWNKVPLFARSDFPLSSSLVDPMYPSIRSNPMERSSSRTFSPLSFFFFFFSNDFFDKLTDSIKLYRQNGITYSLWRKILRSSINCRVEDDFYDFYFKKEIFKILFNISIFLFYCKVNCSICFKSSINILDYLFVYVGSHNLYSTLRKNELHKSSRFKQLAYSISTSGHP